MKISQLYGKIIESADKKRKGVVLGVSYIGNKIEFLFCCDQNEREFFVNINSLLKVGDSIIYEDDCQKLKRTKLLRLGKAGYSQEGNFLGYLEECEAENFTITKAQLGRKNYPFSRLVLGDIIIVKNDTNEKLLKPIKEMFITAIQN